MERFPIEVAIHFRVGQKDLRWATFRDDMQHPGFLQLLDGLGGEDHRGVVLAPSLLCLDDVVTDRLIADEEPRFVEEKRLEGSEPGRIGDFVAGPVQNVKEQRLQDLRGVSPASEVKGLELAERERVFGVIEQEPVLPLPCPTMQPILQLAENVCKVRDRALFRFENVNAFDSVPELAFVPVIKSMPRIISLY